MAMMRKSRAFPLAVMAVCLVADAAPAAPPPDYPQDYVLQGITLPDPGGRYGIGTLSFVVPVAGGEALRVVAWYPATAPTGPGVPYLDADEQRVQAPAIARNFGWPAGALRAVATLPTHSHSGVAPAAGRFPLLIFSHGFFSYPRENTALMEHLAAAGYVVLSLAHPGDAADLPTADGVIPTTPASAQKQPDMGKLGAFWNGHDHRARVNAQSGFWQALHGGRMLASLDRWRGDIVRLTDAVQAHQLPPAAHALGQAIDLRRLAYGGWSFGGSASASACEADRRCRAAINLDGFEFDQQLYDRPMRMPMLLIQSDWTAFPNMGPPSRSYTVYDYAYERWAKAGATPTTYRFRISGVRHLGMIDLGLAPHDPVRDRMFGPADGPVVTREITDLVQAFLDRHVVGKPADLRAVAARYPGIVRHQASEVAVWHRGGRRHHAPR